MNDQPANLTSATVEGVSELPTFLPLTDIVETKDAVILIIEMPGADPETLDITVDKRVLTVSARSAPSAPEGYTLIFAEYRDGNYQRRFTLPDQVDTEASQAVFKDGVLRLTLPKTGPSAKKIAVQAE